MKNEKILSNEELLNISGGSTFVKKPKFSILYPVQPLYSIRPGEVISLYAVKPHLEER